MTPPRFPRVSALAGWAVWFVLALAGCGRSPGPGPKASPGPTPGASAGPAGTLSLTFTYGSEKEEWIKEAVGAFNAGKHRLASGKTVRVDALPMGSGECIDEILTGSRQAHLISPASGAYIDLGNARWRVKSGGHDLVGKTENLLLSPVVIAMWRPMAEALGWGTRPVGWADILALARDGRGWASVGHPEWGSFKFGHTHPEFSNSGLIALLAETYAGAGKKDGLTVDDVRAPETRRAVAGIEEGVVHYGSSTGFFGKKIIANGPGYLNAAVLYESMVVESYKADPPTSLPLVAIYPKEGTFWSDHPVGIVEREWVTPEHREAARALIDYLLDPARQQRALAYGFRPAAVDVPVGAPIDAAHGVDPREPKTTLPVPPVDVLDAVLAGFRQVKKPASLTLVLDISGSMNDDRKIDNARAGAQQFVGALDDRDRLSLLVFNSQSRWVLQDGDLARERARASATLGGLIADGGTALYDSVLAAYQHALSRQEGADAGRITALVVLTDGEDTDSKTKLPALLDAIRFDGEHRTIRVFTIAYGRDASTTILRQIADATQAKSYEGTPENIRTIFRDIATFF